MKKILVMLLVASMSFSVVACASENDSITNNESTNSVNQDSTDGSTNTSDVEMENDYTQIISEESNYWINSHSIYLDGRIIFCEDNTYLSGGLLDELGTWEIKDTTLTITSKDGNSTYYEIKEKNGVYFLIGNNDILCNACLDGRLDTSQFPIKEVEITIDNWQEYFEIATYTIENVDAFGEVTETSECYLKLKDEYYKYLINYNVQDITSEIVLKYKSPSSESESSDCYMDIKSYFPLFGTYWNETYELVKIKGTLYFFDIK